MPRRRYRTYDHVISRQSLLSVLAERPDLTGVLPHATLVHGSQCLCVLYDARSVSTRVGPAPSVGGGGMSPRNLYNPQHLQPG